MVTQGCLLNVLASFSPAPPSTPVTLHFRPWPGTASKSVHSPSKWSPSTLGKDRKERKGEREGGREGGGRGKGGGREGGEGEGREGGEGEGRDEEGGIERGREGGREGEREGDAGFMHTQVTVHNVITN